MISIPKGTKDMLPSEAVKWHYIEDTAKMVAAIFGFKEIRTPIFEHTELFLRGVGETTDIVNKEMYTFDDKGGRSMTLKPEGTAGVARAYIENMQGNATLPLKMFYFTPVFRYERPQSGRLREHHQFGVELYGADSYLADAEVIALAKNFFDEFGLKNLELNINSIGCSICRQKYHKALRDYLASNLNKMCGQCQTRFETNPLRILDCKEEKCKAITVGAPKITDFLCDECKAHFDGVKSALTAQGIAFKVNPMIVRGLDYYTRTVFEFVTTSIGAQGTVCGGGRYNNLVSEVGGKPTPAVGFGLGLERLLMVLENEHLLDEIIDDGIGFYIAPIGDKATSRALKLVTQLRNEGYSAECDLVGRSIKAQMKYADKISAGFVVVIGDSELESGQVIAKDMKCERQFIVPLDKFVESIEEQLDEYEANEHNCDCDCESDCENTEDCKCGCEDEKSCECGCESECDCNNAIKSCECGCEDEKQINSDNANKCDCDNSKDSNCECNKEQSKHNKNCTGGCNHEEE